MTVKYIDDTFTFTVNTFTPSTGAAVDADAVPAYEVYEDETGTAILSGNMAKLNDAGTTGFYSEQITISAANGFEAGKDYSIRITAAVATVTGATIKTFQVRAEEPTAANNWTYGTRTLTSVANSSASASAAAIVDYRGDEWSISITGLGSLANLATPGLFFTIKDATGKADALAIVQIDDNTGLLYINGAAAGTAGNGSITVDDAGAGDITITLKAVESAKLTPGAYRYDVQIVRSTGTGVSTLSIGDFSIVADVTKATS